MSLFEIHVPNDQTQDGAVPLSWCVRPGFTDQLALHEVEMPYVYIIVTHEDATSMVMERRYAVPLDAMLTYIAFTKPGRNRVFAFVASGDYRKAFYESHDRERWAQSPLSYEYWRDYGDHDDRIVHGNRVNMREANEDHPRVESWIKLRTNSSGVTCPGVGPTHIAVDVPAAVFAREPPAWLSAWVNWTYKLPPQDSCEFKRRLIGHALHLQVIQFVLVMTYRILFYALLRLTLVANVSAKPILHPLTFTIDQLHEGDKLEFLPTRWLRSKKALWLIPATPFAAAFGIAASLMSGKSIGGALMFSSGFAITWTVGVLIVAFALPMGWSVLWDAMFGRPTPIDHAKAVAAKRQREAEARARAEREVEHERKARMWYTDATRVAPLVCTPEAPRKPVTSVDELPPERRTVLLRVLEYKATTCKPYAK